ncbi:hypothetical protein DCO58_10005 [Helicobacter saguini]|uniref:Uncharacterized protein n=1 Tax=Helicobacter saguini TaxID=1548018 RepID=A0A347VPH1_9HELI|nr:hypothetical protein [Helicobacter saguini]MWV61362.1 hypothetical protein [Helicobacter saguini]MWV67968.1 hypothetical protein [Helicobacter saguini]MWV70564.1 hypothetical protein [Helicobacter saguini]MWV72468.1 hypothetical protein [Helicobacter saguini]TLD94779.1 hypothetical protein LS64_004570 [Helicobacter saguini]
MFKKFLLVSAALSLGFMQAQSYNGQKRALDFAENVLSDLKDAGVEYNCHGDDSDAACRIRDIAFPLFSTTISNGRFEVSFKDNQYKQRIYAEIDINSKHALDYESYVPKSIECKTTYNLNRVDIIGVENCVIQSGLVTLDFDLAESIHSNEFTDKSMFSIMKKSLLKVRDYDKKLTLLSTSFEERSNKLNEEKYNTIDKLYDDRDSLQELHKQSAENNSPCGCGHHNHKSVSTVELLKDRRYLESSLAKNEKEIKKARENFNEEYEELQEEYDRHLRAYKQHIVKWLSNYDIDVKEARLYIKAPALSKHTFNLYADDLRTFNSDYKLTKKQKKAKAEEKKRITAGYYSSVEAMRAASITFVKESPYLSDNLKKSFSKIIDQHAKLFEPHTGKKSIKILATRLDNTPFNLGKEAQKVVDYTNGDISTEEFLTKVFDVINNYDIRAVRSFPY